MNFHHFGDLNGTPLVYFHGLPSSGDEGELLHQAALKRSVHILAPDRPGFGKTPFQKRTIASTAKQCAEQMHSMGFEKYAVAGCSGGGPYTFALAAVAPESVVFAAPIASMFPFERWKDLAGMHLNNKVVFYLARNKPDWVRPLFNVTLNRIKKDLRKTYFESLKVLPAMDANYFSQPNVAAIMLRAMQNSMLQGNEGAVYETQLFAHDWGVDFSAIRCPLVIWQGEKDTATPLLMAKKFMKKKSEFGSQKKFKLEVLPTAHISTLAAVLALDEFWWKINAAGKS